MAHNSPKVSIIIVNYHVEEDILRLLSSIKQSKPKVSYELIVVDNSEHDQFKKQLRNSFPDVRYIKPLCNGGFGTGNNAGYTKAKGEFLFFLNPDTKVFTATLDRLINFIEKKNIGMVAPLLVDDRDLPFPEQGAKLLTPWNIFFVYTIFHRIFPNNQIANAFWERSWDKKRIRKVDAVPGTAFVIRKSIFEKIGQFDEHFFLYFEEFDLAQKIRREKLESYILPSAKVYHKWEASTKGSVNTKKIFGESRYYYFKKYYGTPVALIVESLCRIGKRELFIFTVCTLLLGLFIIQKI